MLAISSNRHGLPHTMRWIVLIRKRGSERFAYFVKVTQLMSNWQSWKCFSASIYPLPTPQGHV